MDPGIQGPFKGCQCHAAPPKPLDKPPKGYPAGTLRPSSSVEPGATFTTKLVGFGPAAGSSHASSIFSTTYLVSLMSHMLKLTPKTPPRPSARSNPQRWSPWSPRPERLRRVSCSHWRLAPRAVLRGDGIQENASATVPRPGELGRTNGTFPITTHGTARTDCRSGQGWCHGGRYRHRWQSHVASGIVEKEHVS